MPYNIFQFSKSGCSLLPYMIDDEKHQGFDYATKEEDLSR